LSASAARTCRRTTNPLPLPSPPGLRAEGAEFQGRDDHFTTCDDRLHVVAELRRGAGIGIGEFGHAGGHGPPGAIGRSAGVPEAADAGHTVLAAQEAYGDGPGLGSIEDRASLARVEAFV